MSLFSPDSGYNGVIVEVDTIDEECVIISTVNVLARAGNEDDVSVCSRYGME
jgi:hypothetical protein